MNRDQLIEAMRVTASAKPRPIDVPQWGRVYLRDITVAEVELQAEVDIDKADKNKMARAAARVLCDENGVRLFDPENADDVNLIAAQPWSILRRLFAKGQYDDEDAEPGK